MLDLKRKNVILTGGNGFLGKRVRMLLDAEEANVTVPSRQDYDLRFQEQAQALFCDVQNTGDIELVIHAAATVGGIGATATRPADFISDNLLMGVNVIRNAHVFSVKKVVLIGSVCSYPLHAPIPFDEANLWEGRPEETNASYGISKRTLGAVLEAYKKQYGMHGAYLILSNLYGPGDNFSDAKSHVIPALIKKMVAAKENDEPSIAVWGTGNPSRDFLYVQDAADAVVMAAKKVINPTPINIGTGVETKVFWLVNRIAKKVGYTGEIIYNADMPDGQPRRSVRIARAKEFIGWHPRVGIEEGLDATIEWYMESRNGIQ